MHITDTAEAKRDAAMVSIINYITVLSAMTHEDDLQKVYWFCEICML